MEKKTKHNIPPIIVIKTKVNTTTNANVLQTSEYKVKQSWQNIILLGEWVWNKSHQGVNRKPKPTPNHCSLWKHKGHFHDHVANHYEFNITTKYIKKITLQKGVKYEGVPLMLKYLDPLDNHILLRRKLG